MADLRAPDDFSKQLQSALAVASTRERLRKIQMLTRFELTYVQMIQLSQAILQIADDLEETFQRCRFAVITSSTADHLVPALRVAGFRLGIYFDIFVTPFGQHRQQLLAADSALAEFRPRVAMFSLSARELLANTPIFATAAEVSDRVKDTVSGVRSLWQLARRIGAHNLIHQTYMSVGEPLFGSLDRTIPASPSRLVRELNQATVDAAVEDDVSILDIETAVERDGLDFWFDNSKWLQAKIEVSPKAAQRYGELASRIIAAQFGLSKKCLVLDLDNTLWGGVIGDDGIENIQLGEGSGTGEAYLEVQRYVKSLRDRGVILAVCSKNELETAQSAFLKHPDMILKLDDIACFVANWEDKPTNLKSIANKLNVGIDSLVFIDDNPAERDLVRRLLPEIAVPELPTDPSEYVRCLAKSGLFEAISFTAEDAQRSDQYAANSKREELESNAQSLDEFLESLAMQMEVSELKEVDLSRITQLINKTNQFNTTTIRKTHEEVRSVVSDDSRLTLQARLADRFGDHGLISVIVCSALQQDSLTFDIESWVMSCRVFSRQVEFEIMNKLAAMARQRGASFLTATYIPSERNKLIANLFFDLGFEMQDLDRSMDPGESRWKLDLHEYRAHKTYINSGDRHDE